jgi:hypothetical protein
MCLISYDDDVSLFMVQCDEKILIVCYAAATAAGGDDDDDDDDDDVRRRRLRRSTPTARAAHTRSEDVTTEW